MSLRSFAAKLNKIRNSKGFSMAEVLMVVAILAILGAISVGGVTSYRQKLTQTEYDKNAEIIFQAAQKGMVDIMAFDADTFMALASEPSGLKFDGSVSESITDVDTEAIPDDELSPVYLVSASPGMDK